MVDICDIASGLAEAERATILAGRAAPAADGAETCAVCGEPISAARRAACPGATRCAACQAEMEARQHRRVRTGV
jgi:phage/conjugal plasmid C-4 type zinc finger TraR family protein